MKKKITFLCQFSYPEYNSSATLPFDTAKYFASSDFDVSVICGYPREYSNSKAVPKREIVEGVSMYRLPYLQLNRSGRLGRLINYFSFTFSALLNIFKLRKTDTVVVYSNPPILPAVALLAAKWFKLKLVFVTYDVYPEIAYSSGSLKSKGMIAKVMGVLNRKLYKRADHIVALTEEMRDFLLKNRPELSPDRICVIPNWAHEEAYHEPLAVSDTDDDGMVVSYFGNMGICQEMDTLLRAAELLRSRQDIYFRIVGHGAKKEQIKTWIRDNGLTNIQVEDFLLDEHFQKAMSESKCLVLSLEKGIRGMCAPSKYYSYLYSGRAVISITEKESFLAKEIARENVGWAVEIGDAEGLADIILDAKNDLATTEEKGRNAGDLYLRSYRFQTAMEKYRHILA